VDEKDGQTEKRESQGTESLGRTTLIELKVHNMCPQ
jgi:hypothetical protein